MREGGRHIFSTYNCLYQEVIRYIKLVSKIEVHIFSKYKYKNSIYFTFLRRSFFGKFAHIVEVIQKYIYLELWYVSRNEYKNLKLVLQSIKNHLQVPPPPPPAPLPVKFLKSEASRKLESYESEFKN